VAIGSRVDIPTTQVTGREVTIDDARRRRDLKTDEQTESLKPNEKAIHNRSS
jgi:hypothetical protein